MYGQNDLNGGYWSSLLFKMHLENASRIYTSFVANYSMRKVRDVIRTYWKLVVHLGHIKHFEPCLYHVVIIQLCCGLVPSWLWPIHWMHVILRYCFEIFTIECNLKYIFFHELKNDLNLLMIAQQRVLYMSSVMQEPKFEIHTV